MTLQEVSGVARHVAEHRTNDEPFDVVAAGETPSDDRTACAEIVAPYEEVGLTWWVESIDPWRFGWTEHEPWLAGEIRARMRQGPLEA